MIVQLKRGVSRPILIWLEPSGHEIPNVSSKLFWHVCERNGNAKRSSTSKKVCVINRVSLGGHVLDESEGWVTARGE
jgi:hypothetical protein